MAVLGTTKQKERLSQIVTSYAEQLMLRRLADQSPLVPPEGMIGSPVMLVGEAPGAEEVRQLRPFVGPAGGVLDKALKRAELIREWSWVTNTVLYRPPGNRTPYPFEVHLSIPRLTAEIELVQPQFIVLMGATAWSALPLGTESFQAARGKWHHLSAGGREYRVLVTWHPAATFHDRQAEAEFGPHLCMITNGLIPDAH